MSKRRPLPAALCNRAFTVAQAEEVGIGRDRLRAADIVAPHHGIRVPAWVGDTVEDRARALLPALGPHQHFSHVTAAAIWNMPLPTGLETQRELDVTSAGTKHAMRRPGVRGHVSERSHRVVLRGIPVSRAATAWIEIAGRVDLPRLVAIGDALVGPQLGFVGIDDLRAAAAVRRGHRRDVDLALELIRVGAESPKESEVRLLLPPELRASVGLNADVFCRDRFVGRPDLVFVDSMVTVEYEGDHHRDRTTFQNDIGRRRRFEQCGWRVVQVSQRDVGRHPSQLTDRIEAIVRSRGGLGGSLRTTFHEGRLIAVHG